MARWTSVALMLSLLALFVVLVVGSDVPDGVTVTCGDYKIEVSFEKAKFPLLNASRLHLLDSSCKGTVETSTHLKIDTSLNACGTTFTETGETLIFSNVVQDDAEVIDGITREHDFDFSFNCSYSRKKFLSLHFVPEGRIDVPGKGGFGDLTFTFDVYPTESHQSAYANYPVEVTLNEYVYFGYSVQSSADLGIIAVTCKATKDGNFYSSLPQYNFIQSGCGRDTTLRQDYNPNRSNQTFKIRAFRFFNNYDSFYIHCELLACHLNSANSKCSQGCVNGNRRKKRATTEEKISTSDPIILKRGPLKIIEKKSKDTGGLSKQEAAAIIGGATAAGGFALVVVIVLAVLFVKYRFARLLLNRNKVGDLYATQDEEMSRRNAYIQEDDVIEKEDDMIEKE